MYVKWFVSKYQTSPKAEHQQLIHYINRRIEDIEHQEKFHFQHMARHRSSQKPRPERPVPRCHCHVGTSTTFRRTRAGEVIDWLDTFETSTGFVTQDQDSLKRETKLHRLVQEISKEAMSVKDRCQGSSDACLIHLVEVFCHEDSELTKQVHSLKGKGRS